MNSWARRPKANASGERLTPVVEPQEQLAEEVQRHDVRDEEGDDDRDRDRRIRTSGPGPEEDGGDEPEG